MDEKSLKPQLRFKGFTDAWEQRKFDEVISRIATGLNPRDNFKLNSGGTNYYVTIKNFEHGHLHLDENCDIIDDTALKQIQERSDLQKDDILFSSIGRVGDCYLIESKPKNWNINESVFTLRPNKAAVNPLYMFHTIHADCVLSYILNNVTGSTFKSIKISDLKKAIIPLPNKEEQKKLGIFLSKLDNLITLHQRKLDKLSNVKKALLEKMFPKNDSDVPEIRFKGFTDAWEQRKFQDMFSFERPDPYIVKSDKYSNEYTMPVLTANKAFVLGYTKENSPCKKTSLIFDDFTLECKYVDFPYMVKSSAIKILTVKDEKKDNLRFSFERLNTTKIEILGHARHYISVVQPTKTRTPNILEQNKISELFSNLDNLITLHQRKLEKLKNIKKACLEKMFV